MASDLYSGCADFNFAHVTDRLDWDFLRFPLPIQTNASIVQQIRLPHYTFFIQKFCVFHSVQSSRFEICFWNQDPAYVDRGGVLKFCFNWTAWRGWKPKNSYGIFSPFKFSSYTLFPDGCSICRHVVWWSQKRH